MAEFTSRMLRKRGRTAEANRALAGIPGRPAPPLPIMQRMTFEPDPNPAHGGLAPFELADERQDGLPHGWVDATPGRA